jgi:nitroreductase
MKLDQEQLRYILESAILAPSADNHHRIRFQLIDDTVRVWHTVALPSTQGGYKRVLTLLSLGSVAENLSIAASRFAIQAETILFPDPTKPEWLMQIRLRPDQPVVDPLWQVIPLRHTNRQIRFHRPKMTAAERGQLDQAAHAYSACKLIWLDEPAQRRSALRLMRRAESERFRNRILHDELFSAIRFDVGWHATCPEGLPPGALGVEPPLRPFFALLRNWPVARLASLLGAHHLLGWRACDLPCRLAPHLGLLAVRQTDSQSVFDTGRAFQRLWLAATSQGRVLQPMPASALYALDGSPAEGIPEELQRNLAEGWKIGLAGAIPLMLFRMGVATPPSIVAGRPQIEVFLDRRPPASLD